MENIISKKIKIQGIEDINDPFYRYEMTKLNVISQRTTTKIDNIEIVCKDIEREPKLLIDYFKKKFNSSFIFKKGALITTTEIPYKKFENVLREFIEYYILCEKCKLPETDLTQKGNKIILNCKCCSFKSIKNIYK